MYLYILNLEENSEILAERTLSQDEIEAVLLDSVPQITSQQSQTQCNSIPSTEAMPTLFSWIRLPTPSGHKLSKITPQPSRPTPSGHHLSGITQQLSLSTFSGHNLSGITPQPYHPIPSCHNPSRITPQSSHATTSDHNICEITPQPFRPTPSGYNLSGVTPPHLPSSNFNQSPTGLTLQSCMSLCSQSGQIAHPTPAPGQYILKSLHICHAKVSICNGCAQQLKPGGVILPVPNDLVLVTVLPCQRTVNG